MTVGLEAAAQHLSPGATGPLSLAGQDVLVIGAGAMSGLAVAKVVRAGADSLVVASRTRARAERLAASASGRAADMASLPALIAAADLVVTCTGAAGHVITADIMRSALTARAKLRPGPSGSIPPIVVLDLAMPRDVEPAVATLPGVAVTDLETLAADAQAGLGPDDGDVGEVRRIMAEELAAHLSASRAATVSPTVVALRAKAARVVEAELARLAAGSTGWTPQR